LMLTRIKAAPKNELNLIKESIPSFKTKK
jgi:hypothetical protein